MHCFQVEWDKYQTYFVFGSGQNNGTSAAICYDAVECDIKFDEDGGVVVVNGDENELADGKTLCTLEGTVVLF